MQREDKYVGVRGRWNATLKVTGTVLAGALLRLFSTAFEISLLKASNLDSRKSTNTV